MADQIVNSPYYSNPAVKCETASSGIASFLDAYRDLIWGMRWLLAPAFLATLSLVIANAISISVRERRKELAVLKVLGFRPLQILVLVLGESLLLGVLAGFVSGGLTWYAVNHSSAACLSRSPSSRGSTSTTAPCGGARVIGGLAASPAAPARLDAPARSR